MSSISMKYFNLKIMQARAAAAEGAGAGNKTSAPALPDKDKSMKNGPMPMQPKISLTQVVQMLLA